MFDIVVRLVPIPNLFVEIDVEDHKAVSALCTVKTLLLTVFKYVELIAVCRIVHYIGFLGFTEGGHVGDVGVFCQFFELQPSELHAFVGGEIRWYLTIAEMSASRHQ